MAAPGEKVFLDLRADGVTAEGITEMFPPPVYFLARLDGTKIPDKAALMPAIAAALRFPAYFGRNWDALLDCLRSLPEFNPAGGYVLVISGSDAFLGASAKDREDFLDVAGTAAEFLAEKLKIPLRVVFL